MRPAEGWSTVKATLSYRMVYGPSRLAKGDAWCLVKVTTPEMGPVTMETVAVFNFDSEAELFQAHVLAMGLDGTLVEVDANQKQFLELMRRR